MPNPLHPEAAFSPRVYNLEIKPINSDSCTFQQARVRSNDMSGSLNNAQHSLKRFRRGRSQRAFRRPRTRTKYDYDALGRRVSKTVTGLGTTTYLLDGDEEIAEYSGATVLRHYITGPGLDERIAHAEGSTVTNPTKTYYHVNHQGSVMAMTDGSGNLSQRIGYDEYGNGSPATGEQFGYTGRRYDPETQLYYYRARYYAPVIGRFLQVDPVGYKDNLNLYTYVGNDPLDKTDPSGETCTADNGTYTCQVDSIKDAKGNVTQRADFSKAQVKQVAAFEKSYTKAVNDLASHSDRSVTVSVPGGGKDQTATAGAVAVDLAFRNVVASPSEKGGAATGPGTNTTTVRDRGLSGIGVLKGINPSNADQVRQIVATHEGLHDTSIDRTRGDLSPGAFNDAHQVPFNKAAEELLGIKDP